MATWAVLEAEIQNYVVDGTFESTGDNYAKLLTWGNREQQKIASLFTIPEHFKTASITTTTADYQKALPSDYFKSIPITRVRIGDNYQDLVPLDDILYADPDHSDTSSATEPTYCCIHGGYYWQYPMVASTVYIENYVRKPTDMTSGTSPDLPTYYVLDDLLILGVAIRCFKWLEEHGNAEKKGQRELAQDDYKEAFTIYKKFIESQYPRLTFMYPAYEVK